MFRRATAAFLALIALLIASVYYFNIRINEGDVVHYQTLCKEKNSLRSRQSLERQPAAQYRENVQKDIWYSKNGGREHFLLKSVESELTLTQKKKNKIEAAEKLKSIDAWFDDEKTGFAKRITADEGVYYFPDHRFATQAVQLRFYPSSGIDDLRADEIDYDGKNLSLTGHIQMDMPMGHLFAEKAIVENFDFRPSPNKIYYLRLEDQVKIEILEGKIPFSLSAQKAVCDLHPPFSLRNCDEIRFENEVQICSLKDPRLMAKGGLAIYKDDALILYPSSPAAHCQLVKGEDRIDAQKIVYNLSNDAISCEEPEGLLYEKSLRFSARKLAFGRETGKIDLEEDVQIWEEGQFFLRAERGVVDLDDQMKPISVHLADQVQLVSNRISQKESYSASDALDYNIQDKTFILSSVRPKRVLFWQDGLRLSAPEVKVAIDETGIGKIEGRGDVHFSFDLEEQQFIEEVISKYTRFK